MATGIRMALKEAARNRVLWALLIAVPVVFVLLAVATTPDETTTMSVRENSFAFSPFVPNALHIIGTGVRP